MIINLRQSAANLDMDAFEEIMNEIFTYEVPLNNRQMPPSPS